MTTLRCASVRPCPPLRQAKVRQLARKRTAGSAQKRSLPIPQLGKMAPPASADPVSPGLQLALPQRACLPLPRCLTPPAAVLCAQDVPAALGMTPVEALAGSGTPDASENAEAEAELGGRSALSLAPAVCVA